MVKLKVGFYSFTSCEGCQIALIGEELLFGKLSKIIDLARLPIIQQYNDDGPFDVVFVEGAITTIEQGKKIRELREKCKYMVALGTCATFGGITAVRNLKKRFDRQKSFTQFDFLDNVAVNTLDRHVKIDYKIRGCPPTHEEFKMVIKSLADGKIPNSYDSAVCVECRAKKNKCLLGAGEDCLGPVTCGGCGALCPSKSIKCYGCRGPVDKPNVDRLVSIFERRGMTNKQIAEMFTLFAGTTKRYYKIKNE